MPRTSRSFGGGKNTKQARTSLPASSKPLCIFPLPLQVNYFEEPDCEPFLHPRQHSRVYWTRTERSERNSLRVVFAARREQLLTEEGKGRWKEEAVGLLQEERPASQGTFKCWRRCSRDGTARPQRDLHPALTHGGSEGAFGFSGKPSEEKPWSYGAPSVRRAIFLRGRVFWRDTHATHKGMWPALRGFLFPTC